MVECKEDLLRTEDENRRLKGFIDTIMADVGERTPGLKRQREEFEATVDRLKSVTEELRLEKEAALKAKDVEEIYRKHTENLAAENSRLACQVSTYQCDQMI